MSSSTGSSDAPQPDEVVVILKAREPARILTAIGTPTDNRWHLQFAQRWVVHYNIYLNDRRWGRLFVRVCPYFPFSARVCLNQHHWLANRLREEGITFRQCRNAFLQCSDPERLQVLADSLTAHDLITCGQKWLRAFTPFFTAEERREAGCQHRLFFAQTEYCDNLIFQRRAALDQLGARLLDANRTIGQPDSITTIFGRRVTTHHHGKLQTSIHDFHLPNPVIRSHYGHGFVKQDVRDHLLLRTEPATNDVGDYGIRKAVEHLPALRQRLAGIVDNYLDVQQDILETFVDRGQLRRLAEPTVLASGKRLPGLKLDHPRQLALMHALVRFAHVAAGGTFKTADLYPHAVAALDVAPETYTWRHCAMTSRNCAPRASWRRCRAPGATGCSPRATGSASSFSSSSNASTRRSPRGSSSLFAATPASRTPSGINSTGSTSASSTISTACCMPSASRSRRKPKQREHPMESSAQRSKLKARSYCVRRRNENRIRVARRTTA